jgi:imidazole glycerol-phosphate synthase subunit HisH
MTAMLAMIDLKISNIQSMKEAFKRVKADVKMVSSPDDIEAATAVIIPGVGAFEKGMGSLREQNLIEPLREHALKKGKPIIGICLGMQLLAESSSEHGNHQGLGFIKGKVTQLIAQEPFLRVPNMGWCNVTPCRPSTLFEPNRATEPILYFAHSYHLVCDNPEDVSAVIDYGGTITAAIQRDNIFGLQFHPEKSQSAGLEILHGFCAHIQQTSGVALG